MSQARRSVSLSLADGALSLALQFAATLVVARLVAPADIGVFTLAALVLAIAGRLRDFGIGEYLVQAADDAPGRVRAALGLNLLVSWLLAALVFAGAGLIGELYRDPRVTEAIRWMAVNLLVVPFGAVCLASAQRHIDFRPMFIASLLSNLTHFAVAVGGAMAGLGFRSLVFASIAGVAVSVGVAVLGRPAGMSLAPATGGWREMAGFGGHLAGLSVLTQAGRSLNELAIGRVLGVEPTALYSRAQGLVEMLSGLASRVVSPLALALYAADARQGDPQAARFLQVQSLLTGVAWPFLFALAVLAEPVVALLYGPVWHESATLLPVLCLAAGLELACSSWQDLLVSRGAVARAHRLQAAAQLLRLPGLALIGPWGLAGAAWGALLSSLLVSALAIRAVSQHAGIGAGDWLRALRPSLITGLCCLALAWPVLLAVRAQALGGPGWLALAAPVLALGWLLALRLADHPLWPHAQALWLRRGAGPGISGGPA